MPANLVEGTKENEGARRVRGVEKEEGSGLG
jgi:hypothetical protein